MNFNFSSWSIRNPIPPVVVFAVLMLLGWLSFMTLPVTRFPNIDVPVVSVTVTQAGTAPSEMESQITKKIEDAIAGVTGVKHMISTITDGNSLTAVEFRLEVNTDRALNDVKDAVAKARPDLPRTVDEPIIQRVDVEGQSIQTWAVSSPGKTLEELSWYADDVVKRNLQGLKGVGRIERYGGVDREIRVQLDADRLLAYGVTAGEVNRQVRATNIELGTGRGEVGGQEQTIRMLASARSVEALAETKILLSGSREVRLRELGRVFDSSSEQRVFARLDQKSVVTVAVFRAKGASEVDVDKVIAEGIEKLSRAQPDVSFAKIDDSVRYTRGNYEAAMKTLIEGALLAVLVVFLFLKNWRATLITAIALPLSAVPTFAAMSALGFSLNLVSLLGITLATGVLVDDAIVEIENIARHMNEGKSPYRASLEAADEIGLAVIAISFTIMAIFAPVSFMGGIAGQYFKQFGMTVAIAVFFSLLVARLITPMLAAYFLRPVKHPDVREGWIMRSYVWFLRMTLKVRYLTMLAGIGLFAGSIWAIGLLPTGFIPPGDESRIVISAELPPGSTLEDTRVKTDQVVTALKSIPEVKSVFVLGGSTPTGAGREIRKAGIWVHLMTKPERAADAARNAPEPGMVERIMDSVPHALRGMLPSFQKGRSQKEIEAVVTAMLRDVPDFRGWYINPRGERELALSLLSQDEKALDLAVARLEGALRKQPGFSNVAASGGLERPELRISPKLEEAAESGVTPEQISEAVRIATIGDVGPNLAKFNAGDRLIPIRVQIDESTRADLNRIEALRVTNAAGRAIPLKTIADIGFGQGPSSIDRYDRQRRVAIGTDLVGGLALGEGVKRFKELPEAVNLPPGVRLQETGEAEIMGEVFAGFAFAMVTGLMIVLGLLILLFANVFQPITIMLSLPLSIGGVVAALLLTGKPVSMPVVIGILMLMGIVTKNAIMLVDFAIEEVRRGSSRNHALLEAGRKRARPIVMTTIAMAAGMLPSAYGVGDGGEFRAPMAIGVIGGLLVSTVLSLVFVPSFYTVMDDLSRLFAWVFGRFVGPRDEPEAFLLAEAQANAQARAPAQTPALPAASSMAPSSMPVAEPVKAAAVPAAEEIPAPSITEKPLPAADDAQPPLPFAALKPRIAAE